MPWKAMSLESASIGGPAILQREEPRLPMSVIVLRLWKNGTSLILSVRLKSIATTLPKALSRKTGTPLSIIRNGSIRYSKFKSLRFLFYAGFFDSENGFFGIFLTGFSFFFCFYFLQFLCSLDAETLSKWLRSRASLLLGKIQKVSGNLWDRILFFSFLDKEKILTALRREK